jgi:glycine/D-amino acid oxidase-like deaminating enzyme
MSSRESSARVVVIGGGIAGCSAAYHLANLGVTDVVVLERASLSSGTTRHSPGNLETFRSDPLIHDMVRYATEIYPRIAALSGRDIGWRNVGRVMYTDREDRWALLRTLPELARARGMDLQLLTPKQVVQRLPIIARQNLTGGIWVPSDVRVNATDAVNAFARLARAAGATIREHTPVLELRMRNGAITGVSTQDGDIVCEAVIVAAGLWSGDIVQSCGLRLPLHALEQQYLITKPFGVDRQLPLFLSYDDQLYGREEVGGLIIGSFDDDAVTLSTDSLPQDFASGLLNERWDQFEPYMETALRRFPALRTAGINMLLNGPEGFTPDGQMLLGPVPKVTGLYAACGFNSSGLALAPAAGRFIAEWIVEGAPSGDVSALDLRRFSEAQSAAGYVRERVTEIPGFRCRMTAPDTDYVTARDIRRSPLHDRLAEAGARFSSVNAWERALWFARDPNATWTEGVAHETGTAASGVLLVDRSSDTKYCLQGPGVGQWLDARAAGLSSGVANSADLRPLPGPAGQIEALVRTLARDGDRCLLAASPDQETHLKEWLRRCPLPHGIHAHDETAAYVCVELYGSRRAAFIEALTRVSSIPVDIHEDELNGSTLLTLPAPSAGYFWRRSIAAGWEHDLTLGGYFTQETLRIVRGVPAFGREISSHRSRGTRILAAFSSPMTELGFGGREIILADGRAVGELTSRIRLPGWPATLALGLLDPTRWGESESLEAVSGGRTWPLEPRHTPRSEVWLNM